MSKPFQGRARQRSRRLFHEAEENARGFNPGALTLFPTLNADSRLLRHCRHRGILAWIHSTPRPPKSLPFSGMQASAARQRIRAESSSRATWISGLTSEVSRLTSHGLESQPTTLSIEAFNGRFRTDCLNSHWFMSLADAAEKMEAWRRDCNEEHPRSAIGNKVPAARMKAAHASSPCV